MRKTTPSNVAALLKAAGWTQAPTNLRDPYDVWEIDPYDVWENSGVTAFWPEAAIIALCGFIDIEVRP